MTTLLIAIPAWTMDPGPNWIFLVVAVLVVVVIFLLPFVVSITIGLVCTNLLPNLSFRKGALLGFTLALGFQLCGWGAWIASISSIDADILLANILLVGYLFILILNAGTTIAVCRWVNRRRGNLPT